MPKIATLTQALAFLTAIRDNEIDGTERRQIVLTGGELYEAEGFEEIGDTLLFYATQAALPDDTDLPALITLLETEIRGYEPHGAESRLHLMEAGL